MCPTYAGYYTYQKKNVDSRIVRVTNDFNTENKNKNKKIS